MSDTIGRKIGIGNTSEIFEYGDDKILKLYRPGMPSAAAEREFAFTRKVNELLSNTPKAYEMITVDGRSGAVYEKVAGSSMLSTMLVRFWSIGRQARNFARVHWDMQKETHGGIITVREKLGQDIRAAGGLDEEEKSKVLRYLDSLPQGNSLCHFDFHPGNIIMRGKEAVIIDWMTVCAGPKAADAARTSLLLRFAEAPYMSGPMHKAISLFQNKLNRIYLEEYIKVSGISRDEIDKWELPVAAARLREWISDGERKTLLNIVKSHELLQPGPTAKFTECQ